MKTRIFFFLTVISLVLTSCRFLRTSDPGLRYATGPINVQCDNTVFWGREVSDCLSLYKLRQIERCDSLQEGMCKITGHAYKRDWKGVYTGESFGKYQVTIGRPRLIIPDLEIDKNIDISNGTIEITIPQGNHDVLVIAEGNHPIHFKMEFVSQTHYYLDFYFGYGVIH